MAASSCLALLIPSRRAPGGRYPSAAVPAPGTRRGVGARAREKRSQEGGAAAIAREQGRVRARPVRPPSGSRPSPLSSPPPAPRESRGAAGGGGGGGGGGSPRGRVHPAPRRRSHRRLSRRWTSSGGIWRRGRRRCGPDPRGRGRAEGAQLEEMLGFWQ